MIYDLRDTGLIKINRDQWKYFFNKKDSPDTVMDKNSDTYYVRSGEAYAMIDISRKENFVWIHKLLSFSKNHGMRLIENVVRAFPDRLIRINCIGDDLFKYYYSLGFEEDLRINNYREMSVSFESFMFEERTCKNCSFFENNKCKLKKEKKEENESCISFFKI